MKRTTHSPSYCGAPLWQRQLRILRDLSPDEIFIAGAAREEWLASDCTTIPDAQPDAGPLAGLAAALRRSTTPLLLALAIDLPAMTSDYLRKLLALSSDDRGIIPRGEDRFEPLAAVYPASGLPLAQSCLDSGRYSLQAFAERCIADRLLAAKPIATAENLLFFNLNTPKDLSTFLS